MNDPLRHAWQSTGSDTPLPSLETVRGGADRFYRMIRRRNRIEYAACVLVVVFFGIMVFRAHSPAAQLGAALIVLGTIFVGWQLHRRASAIVPPAADAAEPILVHQRAQLVRQRDALEQVGLWYLLPLFPGLMLMMLAPAFDTGPAALLTFKAGTWFAIAVNLFVFGGIWWLNRLVARKLQKAVDEIDALMEEA
jgi:hypothetical protein